MAFVLHAGQLVNNGLCNEPGKYPLDAAYGKTLYDYYDRLNSDLAPKLKTTGLTFGGNFVYKSGGYCQIGNRFYVEIELTVKTALSNNYADAVTGLPRSAAGSVPFAAFHFTPGTNTPTAQSRLVFGNDINVLWVYGTLYANQTLSLSGSYSAQ